MAQITTKNYLAYVKFVMIIIEKKMKNVQEVILAKNGAGTDI